MPVLTGTFTKVIALELSLALVSLRLANVYDLSSVGRQSTLYWQLR